jgi:hypothetical protein
MLPNDHFVAVTVGTVVPLSLILIAVILFGVWSWRKDRLRPIEMTTEKDLVAYDYGWLGGSRGELSAQSPVVFEAGNRTPIVEAGGSMRAELAVASPRG